MSHNTVLQKQITANGTGAAAHQVSNMPIGEYLFSVEGNLDGATVKLVLAQTAAANFADINETELLAPGGFTFKMPRGMLLGVDVDGGGGSLDITYSIAQVANFTQEITR